MRIGTSVIGVDAPDDGSVEVSGTPAVFEAKITGLLADDFTPGLGALVGVATPTNSSFGDEVTPYTQLLFDWQLAAGLYASVNGILSLVPVDAPATRRGTMGVAGVLWLDVPIPGEWLAVYVDGLGQAALVDDAPWMQNVGGGLAFYVFPNELQLDAGVSVAVTGDEHPVAISAGFAWAP